MSGDGRMHAYSGQSRYLTIIHIIGRKSMVRASAPTSLQIPEPPQSAKRISTNSHF